MTELHDKLKKILRLAEGGATEGERDAAMAAAQNLAFKYNIDLQHIDLAEDDVRATITQSEKMELDTWEGDLLVAIAKVNFCDVFFFKRYKTIGRRYVVFGKTHNIDATMDLFEYLRFQLQTEANREVSRRDKRMQYARMALIELARELVPTQYMKRILESEDVSSEADPHYFGPERKIINLSHPDVVDAASEYLMGNDHLLKGAMGLKWIMDRTGLTMSYASEIRPYLRRGEYAPEIVKDLGVWRASFYAAATWRISVRLKEHYNSLVDDAGSTGKDLVTTEEYLLQDYENQLGLSKEERATPKWDTKGGIAGYEAGDRVNIHNRETLSNRQQLEANSGR